MKFGSISLKRGCRDFDRLNLTPQKKVAIIAKSYVQRREVESLNNIDYHLKEFHAAYNSHAYKWAQQTFTNVLGHTSTKDDIADLIARAQEAQSYLQSLSNIDKHKDCSTAMSISYGLDSCGDIDSVIADYNNVRGIIAD